MKHLLLALMLTTAGTVLPPHAKAEQALVAAQTPATVHYRSATVDGVKVFYREAARPTARSCCSCTDSRPPRICSAT